MRTRSECCQRNRARGFAKHLLALCLINWLPEPFNAQNFWASAEVESTNSQAGALFDLGMEMLSAGYEDMARQAFDQSEHLSPGLVLKRYYAAASAQNWATLREISRYVKERFPEDPVVLQVNTELLLGQGRVLEARKSLLDKVEALDKSAPLLALMARIELEDKKWLYAEMYARRALALDSSNTQAADLSFLAMARSGKSNGQILEFLEHTFPKMPFCSQVNLPLAQAYLARGESDKALKPLLCALAVKENSSSASRILAPLLARQSIDSKSIADTLPEVLLISSSKYMRSYLLANLAFVYDQIGQVDKARHYLEEALNASPYLEASCAYKLGVLAERKELDLEKASQSFRQAIQMKPGERIYMIAWQRVEQRLKNKNRDLALRLKLKLKPKD